MTNADKPLLCK